MPLAPRKPCIVPLVLVNLRDDKGTNRPLTAPIYEAPLIENVWENTPGVSVEVQQFSNIGPNGKPWPKSMTQMRTSMAKEEKRLREKYKTHPSTKQPVWQAIYGLGQFPEAFERAVTGRWTPTDKAPEPILDDSDLIDEDDDELDSFMAEREAKMAEEREKALAEAAAAADEPTDAGEAEEATEPKADAPTTQDDRSAQVAALCEVKGLSTELAEAVVDGLGVTSVAELAEIPADELEQVPGIGPVSAKNIVESATELTLAE